MLKIVCCFVGIDRWDSKESLGCFEELVFFPEGSPCSHATGLTPIPKGLNWICMSCYEGRESCVLSLIVILASFSNM